MAHQLGALAAHIEDAALIPSSHAAAHNCLVTLATRDPRTPSALHRHCLDMEHRLPCRQNIHIYKTINKQMLSLKNNKNKADQVNTCSTKMALKAIHAIVW